jgi:hypothetical protein
MEESSSSCRQEGNSELSHYPIEVTCVRIYTALVWLRMLFCSGVHVNTFMKFMVPKMCGNSDHLSHYQFGKNINPLYLISNQSIRRRRATFNDQWANL